MGRVHNLLDYIDKAYLCFNLIKLEKSKMADPRRRKIASQFILTKEQKEKIDKLYKNNYGKKIPYDWHKYYSSYTGHFDEKYIPDMLFMSKIEKKFVPSEYLHPFENKNLLPILVNGIDNVRTANIIISCENGIFRNSNMEFIDYEQAENILYNTGKVFLKPTIDSNSGRGCAILDIKDGIDQKSGKYVKEILKNQGSHYNIQELMVNCKCLRDLHPQSLNTFRVITYIWNNKVYHCPLVLKIAIGQSALDNGHQGGIFVGLDDNGSLNECAFTEFQDRFYQHPDTKIKFDGYKIPQVPEMLEAVKKLHQRIPQVGIISWDVTIDNNNSIVIVEINLFGQSIWHTQMTSGKGAFGENTAEILKWIGKK